MLLGPLRYNHWIILEPKLKMNSNKCSYMTHSSLAWHDVCTSSGWLRTTQKLNVMVPWVADIVNKMTQVTMPPSSSSKLLILNKKLLRFSLKIVRMGNVWIISEESWFPWVCQSLQPRRVKMLFFPRVVMGEWSLLIVSGKAPPKC